MFPVLIKSKLIFLYWGCYWFFQWNWIGKLIKLLSFLTSLIDVLYFSFSFTLNSSSFVFHDFIFMFIYTSFTAFGLKFLFIYYYLLFLFTSYSLFGIISTFFFPSIKVIIILIMFYHKPILQSAPLYQIVLLALVWFLTNVLNRLFFLFHSFASHKGRINTIKNLCHYTDLLLLLTYVLTEKKNTQDLHV